MSPENPALFLEQLKEGALLTLCGGEHDALTAAGGDLVLLWIHGYGYAGFVHLPEKLTPSGAADSDNDYSVEAAVVKVCVERLILVNCCKVSANTVPSNAKFVLPAALRCCRRKVPSHDEGAVLQSSAV